MVLMIIAVATGTGLQKEIQGKLIGFTGHIQVTKFDMNASYESPAISIEQDFYPHISFTGFTHIQKYATKAGILKSKSDFEGLVLKGISDDYNLDYLNSVLISGVIPKYGAFRNDSILVSKHIKALLKLNLGDTAQMFFMQKAPKPPRIRNFVIAGVYETGLEDIDNNFIVGNFDHIKRLNRWDENEAGGFEVFIDDFDQLDQQASFLKSEIPFDLTAESLKRKNEKIFQWLDLFDMNIYIIIVIMLLVASLNMIMALFIIILERAQLIGILKTLGANNLSIRNIFLRQSASLIFKGMFWGNLIGIGFCYLQKFTGLIKLDQSTYYVTEVPIDINWFYILGLNLGIFITCLLAMMVPSLLVTRIKPVKVLRFD
jgi:lipoprotein-releasing system permease protein